MERNKRMK